MSSSFAYSSKLRFRDSAPMGLTPLPAPLPPAAPAPAAVAPAASGAGAASADGAGAASGWFKSICQYLQYSQYQSHLDLRTLPGCLRVLEFVGVRRRNSRAHAANRHHAVRALRHAPCSSKLATNTKTSDKQTPPTRKRAAQQAAEQIEIRAHSRHLKEPCSEYPCRHCLRLRLYPCHHCLRLHLYPCRHCLRLRLRLVGRSSTTDKASGRKLPTRAWQDV